MTRITRVALADQVADALLDRIRAEEWPIGTRLPGENALAPQLGVGRSTLREAIRQLAGQGVLTTRQGAGVFVTALDIVDDLNTVLQRADIIDVIEARVAIESEAAALAAKRRTPAELRGIRHALAGRQDPPSIEAYVDADTRFHRSIVAAAHNAVLLEMFDRFTPRSREAMITMLRLRPASSLGDPHDQLVHEALVTTIAERDSDGASQQSRAHLNSLKTALS